MATNEIKDKPLSLLERLKAADETISIPIFQLSLPKPLEFLLSLPGNLLGPPAMQVVGPLWFFVLDPKTEKEPQHLQQWLLTATAVGTTILLLILPFLLYLRGNVKMLTHGMFSHTSFALSTLVGIAICYYYNNNFGGRGNLMSGVSAAGLGYHGTMLYCLSCAIILHLKHNTRRLRPCVVYPQYIERKHFCIIPKVLAEQSSFTSFPSGDAMGATCWALPLLQLGYTKAAIVLVGLAAFGRMFFLAHHLGDTLAGIFVAIGFHVLLNLVEGLPSIGTAEWYHPLLALTTLVIASRFRKGDQK